MDYHESIKYALDALKFLKKKNSHNEEKLMVLNRLTQLHHLLGDNENALIYAKQGEELLNIDNNLGNQDAFYNALARIYHDLGEFDLAIEYSEKSIKKIANKTNKIIIGEIPTYMTRPVILLKMHKYKEAYNYLKDLYDAMDEVFGANDHFYKATVFCFYGYALFKYHNKTEKALVLIKQSQKIFLNSLKERSNKDGTLALSHKFLGEIYQSKGEFVKAQEEYATALQLTINSYNNMVKKTDNFSNLYTLLAIISVKLNDPASAQQYLDMHRKMFGHNHPRTIQIVEYFVDNMLPVGY